MSHAWAASRFAFASTRTRAMAPALAAASVARGRSRDPIVTSKAFASLTASPNPSRPSRR